MTLENTDHIPFVLLDKLSCNRKDEHGLTTLFQNGQSIFSNRNKYNELLGTIQKRKSDGLYATEITMPKKWRNNLATVSMRTTEINNNSRNLSHRRMGHPANEIVSEMTKTQKYGMKSHANLDETNCDSCVTGKHRKATPKSKLVDEAPSTKIYLDICGRMSPTTLGGNRYFLTMTTTPRRYIVVKGIKAREEAVQHIYDYIARVDRNSDKKVKSIRTDNTKEFLAIRRNSS